jgi:OOP family OmpA-OmpF porin
MRVCVSARAASVHRESPYGPLALYIQGRHFSSCLRLKNFAYSVSKSLGTQHERRDGSMKSLVWKYVLKGALLVVMLACCRTLQAQNALGVTPVVPRDNDQLIVLVDVSGTILAANEYDNELALVNSFIAAMPDGTYESGIDSFGGTTMSRWMHQPMLPFNRATMAGAADRIEPLGSLTELAHAVLYQKPEMAGKVGRGALLVFSDGRVDDPNAVLRACQDLKAVHGGELCIYTVHIGAASQGVQLLQDMASTNGCGKYYEGASLNSAEAIYALVRDIFMGPREVPAPPAPAPAIMTLKNVHFDNDSAVIAPSYNALLDEAAGILKNNPEMRLRLDGHTDSNASNAYNQKLSERRVNAVRDALVQRGVDAARLVTGAHGEETPAVPNDTPENRHQNRRVELSVIE